MIYIERELADNESTFSSHWTRTVNDIVRNIITGKLEKVMNAYNWIQPYTHVNYILIPKQRILVIQTASKIISQTEYLSYNKKFLEY